jgi:hypothetical protein
MATGYKTGGRKAGTPNRKTREVGEILEALCCNPIEGMAKIAMDPENPIELRARMLTELAPYVYPKRRALEQRLVDGEGKDRPLTLEDYRKMVEEAEKIGE